VLALDKVKGQGRAHQVRHGQRVKPSQRGAHNQIEAAAPASIQLDAKREGASSLEHGSLLAVRSYDYSLLNAH
jgi:hypothetical protein